MWANIRDAIVIALAINGLIQFLVWFNSVTPTLFIM
jgi:hypothetical protein